MNGSSSSSAVRETLRGLDEESSSSSSSIGIWAGICLTLVLVIAFFMLILFQYKKKLHQVKEELNYVTYTTDRSGGSSAGLSVPQSAPSVYAQVVATDSSIPNNAVKHFVVNDLKSGQQNKESNIERAAVLKKEAAIEGTSDVSILPLKSHFPLTPPSLPVPAAPSSSSGASGGYDLPDEMPDLPPGPRTPVNPNIYRSVSKELLDKEPIYEELKDPMPLPPTLGRKQRQREQESLSPQPSLTSSVYDAPRTLSRSSSRGSSVADNSLVASPLTSSPVKVSNNLTAAKILNRLDEEISFEQPSTSSSSSSGRRLRTHVYDEDRDEEEDRSISEEKIYANDINCHQKEI